jgi:hypothetical protein
MKIEVGKYYKSANGRKVGPIKLHEHGGVTGFQFDASGDHGTSQFYNENGKADDGSEFDLIAELDDTFFGLEKTRFTDDELERIAKVVADALVEALRQ